MMMRIIMAARDDWQFIYYSAIEAHQASRVAACKCRSSDTLTIIRFNVEALSLHYLLRRILAVYLCVFVGKEIIWLFIVLIQSREVRFTHV